MYRTARAVCCKLPGVYNAISDLDYRTRKVVVYSSNMYNIKKLSERTAS